MIKTVLRQYARLIARVGANVQKGQEVVITCDLDQPEFVRLLTEECYRAGARKVRVDWSYDPLTKIHARWQKQRDLARVEDWEKARLQHMVDVLPVRIFLESSDPDGLNGIHSRYFKALRERALIVKPYRDAIDNRHQWCIAAVPGEAWARKLYPQLTRHQAVERLWQDILFTSRADGPDPVAAWAEHNADLKQRCEYLNSLGLRRLRYRSASGTDFSVGRRSGMIDYLNVDGQRMLQFRESITPEFWRAPTDNDYGAGLQNRFSVWKNPDMRVTNVTSTDNSIVATIEMREPEPRVPGGQRNRGERRAPFATLTMTYTLTPEGEVIVREQLAPNKDAQVSDMFRYGMQLQMPKQYDRIEYYGRGPVENYIDRNSSEFIGVYSNKVQDEYFEYVRPQESGNHTDVRWFRVVSAGGQGLEFYSNAPMEASAMPYTMDQLDDGPSKDKKWGHHSGDLIAAGRTQVFIQQRQFGLGCVNSWGAWPLEQYRVPCKDYDFTFAIKPLRAESAKE